MVVHMVGIGEETGNVEEMLTNSAVYYEEEVEVQTQTLTSLMEPIIIVLMALLLYFDTCNLPANDSALQYVGFTRLVYNLFCRSLNENGFI